MIITWTILISVACLLCIFIPSIYRNSKVVWVRMDGELICVGIGKKAQSVAWKDIGEISVAPLHDVHPFDDLWILDGQDGTSVSFLDGAPGASTVLTHLEAVLANFHVTTSIAKAQDESLFEQPVIVWSSPK